MDLSLLLLAFVLLFAALGLTFRRAPKPRSPVEGNPLLPARTAHQIRVNPAMSPEVQPPDVFNENRVRMELAAFARTPGVGAQILGRARSSFTKSGERAIIRDWTAYFQEAEALIAAKTEMERKRSALLQLASEHEVRAKEKEVAIAQHDAQIAEENFRRETAEYKRGRLDQFIEGAKPSEPKLTSTQQRLLKRAEIEQELLRLKLAEDEALQKAESDPERRRIQNMYAGRRSQLTEQLEKNL